MIDIKARATYQLPSVGLIRTNELLKHILPVSRTTVWRMIRSGHFPPPIKLGHRTSAWRVEDIREWIENKGVSTGT